MLAVQSTTQLASLILVATLIGHITVPVHAHTWIDCIDHSYDVVYTNSDKWVLDGENGYGVCEGYGYKFPGRGVSTIGTDYTWKLLPHQIHQEAPVCQYHRDQADYSGWRHRIHAKPGDTLYLAYFSNGHIVKDGAGPGTTWGVYWSGEVGVELTKPSELTQRNLVDGKLNDYDDGNCGQNFAIGSTTPSGRAGDYKPCVGTVTIPEGTKPGTYQMVWYWTFFKALDYATDFQTFDGAGGAAYSTCFDVTVEDDGTSFSVAEDTPLPTVSPTPSPSPSLFSSPTQSQSSSPSSSPSPPLAAPLEEPTVPAQIENALIPASTPKLCIDGTPSTTSVNALPPIPAPSVSNKVPSPGLTQNENSKKKSARPAKQESGTLSSSGGGQSPSPTPAAIVATAPSSNATPSSSPSPAAPLVGGISQNPYRAPRSVVTINGVGGTGAYGKVTEMTCPSQDSCVQSEFAVSGPLAPFDEDLTLALRGPMHVDDIVVFTQDIDRNEWSKVSSYCQQDGSVENMVFLNNRGDPERSGEFDQCNGHSQSYATSNATTSADEATLFDGQLADDVEINVMSGTSCHDSASCGYSRGVAHEGWKGANKIFMIKAQMPHGPNGCKDLPAIWLLNGQVVRTAQYGCNCRGIGDHGKWKGGCGELDVAEVISGDLDSLTSTIYSFKGSRGTNSYALRPTEDAVVFVVILSESATTESMDLGMAQILMMHPEDVDLTTAPTAEQVEFWKNFRGMDVDFDI